MANVAGIETNGINNAVGSPKRGRDPVGAVVDIASDKDGLTALASYFEREGMKGAPRRADSNVDETV